MSEMILEILEASGTVLEISEVIFGTLEMLETSGIVL